MNKILYYSFLANDKKRTPKTFLFIPFDQLFLTKDYLQKSLRDYYSHHPIPSHIIVQCSFLNHSYIQSLFTEEEVLNYIPFYKKKNTKITIYSISAKGKKELKLGGKLTNYANLQNRVLSHLFSSNGGLINSSNSAHHFEFPSGKHATQFLRTGNILISGTTILYIAHCIYELIADTDFDYIYCDTSSIASIAYALNSILIEFGKRQKSLHIESFGSYKAFENNKLQAPPNTLFLISSSTSGSILKRLQENSGIAYDLNKILILFGLTIEKPFKRNLLCNLDFNAEINPQGIEPIKSIKKGHNCKYCNSDSIPLKVTGDVFLLEKPEIRMVTIDKVDLPGTNSSFSDFYFKNKTSGPLIRAFFKEKSSDKKYESFIDIDAIIEEWPNRKKNNHAFERIFKRLQDYIALHIPSSTKYLIHLDDSQSKRLAELVREGLIEGGADTTSLKLQSLSELNISKEGKGTISVIGASIVSGRNLLYASKALREFEKNYRRFYFIFINRYHEEAHKTFLKNNLGFGIYGLLTNPLICVYEIMCSRESKTTPWHEEIIFLKNLEDHIDEFDLHRDLHKICENRTKTLNESSSKKGLSNNLFWPSLTDQTLVLNKGFAFAPHDKFYESSSFQSEIYLIISSILTNMRNKNKIRQSEYVRCLLSPGNFIRYNDGVIQASILRAAKKEELRYDLDSEASYQLLTVILDMLKYKSASYAEALNEFLYAIALKKLRLTNDSLDRLIQHLETQIIPFEKNTLQYALVHYIKLKVYIPKNISTYDRN